MKLTIEEKLLIAKEHVDNKVPINELYQTYNLNPNSIKYYCNLYKRYGEKAFEDHGTTRVYTREMKLQAIDAVLNGGKSRYQVALDLMLTDYKIVNDWVEKYKKDGPEGIKDTHSRSHYLVHEERLKTEANKKLLERLEYLEAENEYLKKLYALAQEKKTPRKRK